MGVRRFSTLPYAHKPGIATYLNDWAAGFARDVPESLWSATFYPEPEAAAYVDKLVGAGVEVFKLHLQVGEFHLDDPALNPVWGILEDAGTPIVIHAGSGPVGNEFTGPEPLQPRARPLPAAGRGHRPHGRAGVRRFLALAETHERVRLDTTMVFTDFFEAEAPYPGSWRPGWSTSSPRCCSAPTSRPSRTPTPTSSRVSPGSTWATTGCATSAGTTACACSVLPTWPDRSPRHGSPGEAQSRTTRSRGAASRCRRVGRGRRRRAAAAMPITTAIHWPSGLQVRVGGVPPTQKQWPASCSDRRSVPSGRIDIDRGNVDGLVGLHRGGCCVEEGEGVPVRRPARGQDLAVRHAVRVQEPQS